MVFIVLNNLYEKFYIDILVIFIGLIFIGLGITFYKNRYKWVGFHSNGYMKKIMHDRERYVKESSSLWVFKAVLCILVGLSIVAIGIYLVIK